MATTFYPIDLKLNYDDDVSYRKKLRTLIGMEGVVQIENGNENEMEDDDITSDENNYDEIAVGKFLDKVYIVTKDSQEFRTLYLLAAGTMLSEDMEIGLAVLFSYNYLTPFHEIMCRWIKEGSLEMEYKTLVAYFSSKRD